MSKKLSEDKQDKHVEMGISQYTATENIFAVIL